jgi:hypothetical protein
MNWLVSINIQRMMITVVIASSLQLKFGWACLAVEAVDLLTSTFSSLVSDHHPNARPNVLYNLQSLLVSVIILMLGVFNVKYWCLLAEAEVLSVFLWQPKASWYGICVLQP